MPRLFSKISDIISFFNYTASCWIHAVIFGYFFPHPEHSTFIPKGSNAKWIRLSTSPHSSHSWNLDPHEGHILKDGGVRKAYRRSSRESFSGVNPSCLHDGQITFGVTTTYPHEQTSLIRSNWKNGKKKWNTTIKIVWNLIYRALTPSQALMSESTYPQEAHVSSTSHFSSAGWTLVSKPPHLGHTKYFAPHPSHILKVPFSTNRNVRFIHSSVTWRKAVPLQTMHFFSAAIL